MEGEGWRVRVRMRDGTNLPRLGFNFTCILHSAT